MINNGLVVTDARTSGSPTCFGLATAGSSGMTVARCTVQDRLRNLVDDGSSYVPMGESDVSACYFSTSINRHEQYQSRLRRVGREGNQQGDERRKQEPEAV